MSMNRYASLLLCLLCLSGCASSGRYEWSDYDSKLYDHYREPAQNERFIEAIKEAVDEAEAAKRVPPGLYAEYGFLLSQQGNYQAAIAYYRKESDTWPESRYFMAKMIANTQKLMSGGKRAPLADTPVPTTAASPAPAGGGKP